MKMDLNYIKKLIKILDTSNVAEIEIEEEGTKLRLSKPKAKLPAGISPMSFTPVHNINPAENIVAGLNSDEGIKEITKSEELKSENLFEVKSPMVGTFYRAPSPDAEPYVNAGSDVSPGTVLCIIEAMKLMNEIESEVSGKIVKVLAENAQPVEYNQPLFLIKKD